MSKRELAIAFILVMGILAPIISLFPSAEGAWPPEEQTIDIVDTHDDRWITETGRLLDSPLVQILDPNIGITSYLIFRDVEINFWEPLTNATLRLRTTSNQSFDDSSVTIYGMKVDELQTISVGASFILSVPYTTAYVNYNTSLFTGAKWHDIDVTNIVEELIRAHNWDGVDYPGDVGDAIGFIILGAKGSEPRWFQDYRSYPPKSADLVIHWNHRPPGINLPDDSEWIEQYRNYTIWGLPIYGNFTKEYVFWRQGGATPSIYYDTVHPQPSEWVYIAGVENPDSLYAGGQRQITRIENGTIYVVYESRGGTATDRVWVKHSSDEGATWSVATELYPGFVGSERPRIAVDSNNTIHVVCQGLKGTDRDIWYVNYTDTWSNPIGIIRYDTSSYAQYSPAIAIDEGDNLHVAWSGTNQTFPAPNYQIFYANRTVGWSSPLRINTVPTMNQRSVYPTYPSITCDSNNVTHVSFRATNTDYDVANYQIWHTYTYSNNSWAIPVRVSTYAGMNTNIMDKSSLAISYLDDTAHLVWNGRATGFGNLHIWYAEYNGTWTTPIPIANYPGMTGQHQFEATIAVYPDDTIHVLWSGKATGYTVDNCIWDRPYNTSWGTVQLLQDEWTHDLSSPNLAYSRFPETFDITYTYFITDLNGTIVENDCPDVDCAKDKIDDIMGDDPMDPEPSSWEDEPVVTSRFRMRLYSLVIGYGCVWGPIWFMCWKRPSGFHIGCAFLVMLIGVGLLLSVQHI